MNERERLAGLLAGAREDRKRLRAALDAKESELAKVSRELEQTRHWLEQIETARTWRLTSPLRRVAGAVRTATGGGRASRPE